MTQQHYEEREKKEQKTWIPQSFSQPHVYSSSMTSHFIFSSETRSSYLNVSFCFMTFLSLFFQGQLFYRRGVRNKNAIVVITSCGRARALRHSILFSPRRNWLICAKQISPLWRFMVHRKLNWCLFSAKLLNITGGGISGSACWETPGGGGYTSHVVFVPADERARLVEPHVHVASPHLHDQSAAGFERPWFNFTPSAVSPSCLFHALQLKMHREDLSEEGGNGG